MSLFELSENQKAHDRAMRKMRRTKGNRGRPSLRVIFTQSGSVRLFIAIRLKQYDQGGRLSRALSGHPNERQLWNIWRALQTCPLIYGKINPKGKMSAWLEEIGLPDPRRIFMAGRLKQYREAGCLERLLAGHQHEAMLRRLWPAYRSHPLVDSIGRPPFSPTVENWLAASGLPPPPQDK